MIFTKNNMHELSDTAPQHPKKATMKTIAPATINTFEVNDISCTKSLISLSSFGMGLSRAPNSTMAKPRHCNEKIF